MISRFEDMEKFGKDNVDVMLKSAGAVGKSCQAVTAEAADYTKKSIEAGTAAFEKMLAAQSLDRAFAVQSDFVRSAYQDYIGQVAKFGEMFSGMAKEAYKPYENLLGKFGK